jgi:hypothetical protein
VHLDAQDGTGTFAGTLQTGFDDQRIEINPEADGLARIDMYDNGSTDHVSLVNFGGNFLQQRETDASRAANGGRILWQPGTSYFAHQDPSNDAYLSFSGDDIRLKGQWAANDSIGGLTAVFTKFVNPVSGNSASVSYGSTMVGAMNILCDMLYTSGNQFYPINNGTTGETGWKSHVLSASSSTGFSLAYPDGNYVLFIWAVRTT